jgi:glycogen operon protein
VPPAEFGSHWDVVVDTRPSTAEVDAVLVPSQLDLEGQRRYDHGSSRIVGGPERLGAPDSKVLAGDPLELDARSTVVMRRAH